MLLSIEISLYCPRFAILEVKEGKANVVFTGCNDRKGEAGRHVCRRTPDAQILSEIEKKLKFILNSYSITKAVWFIRLHGVANREAALMAKGVILLTLYKAGLWAIEEMTGSRMKLYLTGSSKALATDVMQITHTQIDTWKKEYELFAIPIAMGLAWARKNS